MNNGKTKISILEKYADYLAHQYPEWTVELLHKVSNGTAGVWGIIQLTQLKKPEREPILLRVRPRYGVDEVVYKGKKFFAVRTVLTKEQLQLQFGFAPVPREITRKAFPFADIDESIFDTPLGGVILAN